MGKNYSHTLNTSKAGEVEVEIKVTKDFFKLEKEKVFNKLAPSVELSGFRKGKGPKNLIEARLGSSLFEETVNTLAPTIFTEVLELEKLDPMTTPEYSITKVSDEDGLEFSVKFVPLPKIELADFSKIKVEKKPVKVEDTELEKAIERVMQIRQEKEQKTTKKPKTESKSKEDKKFVMPTDKQVKDLNIGFTSLADLKTDLLKRLEIEKKKQQEQHRVAEILDKAIKLSKIKVPQVVIQKEVENKLTEYTKKITDLGLKIEDFLKSQNSSLDKLKSEWEKEYENRVSQELILMQIALENNLKVNQEDVQKEIDSITDEKLKQEYDSPEGRRYIVSVILQQKALNLLLEQVKD